MTDHPSFNGIRKYWVSFCTADSDDGSIFIQAESKHDAEQIAIKEHGAVEILEVEEQ